MADLPNIYSRLRFGSLGMGLGLQLVHYWACVVLRMRTVLFSRRCRFRARTKTRADKNKHQMLNLALHPVKSVNPFAFEDSDIRATRDRRETQQNPIAASSISCIIQGRNIKKFLEHQGLQDMCRPNTVNPSHVIPKRAKPSPVLHDGLNSLTAGN